MVVRPGFFTANLPGKQAGALAETTANANSGYVYSTGNTVLGDTTIFKKSGTSPSGVNWDLPTYDSLSETMSFNGSHQAMPYNPNAIQVAPLPFSFQIDFNTTKSTGNQYIFNMGQGSGVGWPCFQVALSANNLYMSVGTANTSGTATSWSFATIVTNKWYRIGIMFYRVGNSNILRGYLNGEIKIQQTLGTSATNVSSDPSSGGIPRKDSTGFVIGADNANFSGFNFQGQIRNFYMDNVQFWSI